MRQRADGLTWCYDAVYSRLRGSQLVKESHRLLHHFQIDKVAGEGEPLAAGPDESPNLEEGIVVEKVVAGFVVGAGQDDQSEKVGAALGQGGVVNHGAGDVGAVVEVLVVLEDDEGPRGGTGRGRHELLVEDLGHPHKLAHGLGGHEGGGRLRAGLEVVDGIEAGGRVRSRPSHAREDGRKDGPIGIGRVGAVEIGEELWEAAGKVVHVQLLLWDVHALFDEGRANAGEMDDEGVQLQMRVLVDEGGHVAEEGAGEGQAEQKGDEGVGQAADDRVGQDVVGGVGVEGGDQIAPLGEITLVDHDLRVGPRQAREAAQQKATTAQRSRHHHSPIQPTMILILS